MNAKTETITIRRTATGYSAQFSDPEVRFAFGTDVLPTAFTSACPLAKVVAEIAARNPQAQVVAA